MSEVIEMPTFHGHWPCVVRRGRLLELHTVADQQRPDIELEPRYSGSVWRLRFNVFTDDVADRLTSDDGDRVYRWSVTGDGVFVHRHSLDGSLVSTGRVLQPQESLIHEEAGSDPVDLVAVNFGATQIVGIGGRVLLAAEGPTPKRIEVAGNVRSVAVPSPRTRFRLAVCHSRGLEIVWPGAGGVERQTLEDCDPVDRAVWRNGGRLYALVGQTLRRYDVRGTRAVAAGSIHVGPGPSWLLPMGDDVALLGWRGWWQRFR